MIRICIVKHVRCEYGHFHQDFDGGYQDAVATIETTVYCDNLKEISYQEIGILRGCITSYKQEFEQQYADVSSSEYESGSTTMPPDNNLLQRLNVFQEKYVYCSDSNLCPFDLRNVVTEEEKKYEDIKEWGLSRIAEEESRHNQRLCEIKREEQQRLYAFFRDEILKGKFCPNKPFSYEQISPIESAINAHDTELFLYILRQSRFKLFSQETQFERDICKKIVSSPSTVNSLLSYASNCADYVSYNSLCNNLIEIITTVQ